MSTIMDILIEKKKTLIRFQKEHGTKYSPEFSAEIKKEIERLSELIADAYELGQII